MATSVVQVRVDDELKTQATALFEEHGLDLSTAIRMFMKRSVLQKGIPFSMTLPNKPYDGYQGILAMRQLSEEAKRNGFCDAGRNQRGNCGSQKGASGKGYERMTYYAVIDTNVLVSAMLSAESVPGAVAAEAMAGRIIPLISDDILAEYEAVLNRRKFRFDRGAVKDMIDTIVRRGIPVDAGPSVNGCRTQRTLFFTRL